MRLVGALSVALLVVGIVATLSWRMMHAPAGAERWVRFTVPEGVSLGRTAAMLADSGLLRHPLLFTAWGRLKCQDRNLQAGDYLFSASMTPVEILRHLVRGQVVSCSVTFPEGVTLLDIASALRASVGVDSAEFVRFCYSDSFIASLGLSAPSLEGYLFPDTYAFTHGARADRVASVMVGRLRAVLNGIDWDEELTGLSLHEILTLASIVEKETARASERPMVAAVYLNRLAIGMKLDADPTVAYGLGKPGKPPSTEDLRVPTPYNTYLQAGLPPGPICSPGLGSIMAVLHPDRSCKALFFVARGDGTHEFSETFSDHLAAIQTYRRGRSSAP